MVTLEQLERLEQEISGRYDELSRVMQWLVKREIERRRRAGRKPSGKTREQINRESQARFRAKKKGLT